MPVMGLVASTSAAPEALKVELSATKSGNTVTYSLTLINDGAADLGDVF